MENGTEYGSTAVFRCKQQGDQVNLRRTEYGVTFQNVTCGDEGKWSVPHVTCLSKFIRMNPISHIQTTGMICDLYPENNLIII